MLIFLSRPADWKKIEQVELFIEEFWLLEI